MCPWCRAGGVVLDCCGRRGRAGRSSCASVAGQAIA
jgi:hypothetical protein